MTRRWPLFLGLFLGLSALFLGMTAGVNHVEALRFAARWTARVGFPVFLVAYSASSLGRLWPAGWTRALWRDRRWWGLGFAASHTVHLFALIAFLEASGETRPLSVYLVAGTGYVLMYLMVLTSSDAAMRALGRNWKRLHTVGIHWLWFVFFASYAGRIMKPETMLQGTIGTTLALGALGLRVAVWRKGRRPSSAVPA